MVGLGWSMAGLISNKQGVVTSHTTHQQVKILTKRPPSINSRLSEKSDSKVLIERKAMMQLLYGVNSHCFATDLDAIGVT